MSGGTSYNGWPANSDPAAIDVDPNFTAAGSIFPGGMRSGGVSTAMRYLITRLNQIEPAILPYGTGGLWGYSYRANVNDPDELSCHASATAVDYNAVLHPNGVAGSWGDAAPAVSDLVHREMSGAIQWGESTRYGGDYTGTPDGMHFEIIVSAGRLDEIVADLPDIDDDDDDTRPDEGSIDVTVLRIYGTDGSANAGDAGAAYYLVNLATMVYQQIMTDVQRQYLVNEGILQRDSVPAGVLAGFRYLGTEFTAA